MRSLEDSVHLDIHPEDDVIYNSRADVVLIFPCDQRKTLSADALELCNHLRSLGLEITLFTSSIKSSILVATISIPLENLGAHASLMRIRLPMNPYALRALYNYGDMNSFDIKEQLECIYLPYSAALEDEKLFCADSVAGGMGVFQPGIQQKIVLDIISTHCDIEALTLRDEIILDCFAPHDEIKTVFIWSLCTRIVWLFNPLKSFRRKELFEVREYLGRDTVFFLSFLCHFAKWTTPIFFMSIITKTALSEALIYALFGLTLPFWLYSVCHFWERESYFCAVEWGIGDQNLVSASEQNVEGRDFWQLAPNPEFRCGEKDETTLWPLPYTLLVPTSRILQGFRLLISAICSVWFVLFATIVLGAPISLIRYVMTRLGFSQTSAWYFPVVCHALALSFFSGLIGKCCRCFTTFENRRTQIGHHVSLLSKSAIAGIVLWTSPALYVFFVQEALEGSCGISSSSCGSMSVSTALVSFAILSAHNIATMYIIPLWRKRQRSQYLARNQSSLHVLSKLSMAPAAASRIDQEERLTPLRSSQIATQDQKNYPGSHEPKPIFARPATFYSAQVEREFLLLDRGFTADRAVDERSAYSAHYQSSISLIIKCFALVCWGGYEPVMFGIFLCCTLLEVILVIAVALFSRRRSVMPSKALVGIDGSIVVAMKVTALLAALLLPSIYQSRAQFLNAYFNINTLSLFPLCFLCAFLLYGLALRMVFPIVPDSVKLVLAKQSFFERDLLPSTSGSGSGSGHAEQHIHVHVPEEDHGNGEALSPNFGQQLQANRQDHMRHSVSSYNSSGGDSYKDTIHRRRDRTSEHKSKQHQQPGSAEQGHGMLTAAQGNEQQHNHSEGGDEHMLHRSRRRAGSKEGSSRNSSKTGSPNRRRSVDRPELEYFTVSSLGEGEGGEESS